MGAGKMIKAVGCLLATVAVAYSMLPAAAAQSCDTAKVLAQMDAAAARFQSAQADFNWDVLQSLVNEHDIQKGTIYFDRHAGATSMAAYIKQPAEKTVLYSAGTLTLVEPALKQETLFSAGTNRGQYESFLTIGFGGSGKDLAGNWDVSCAGMETIDGTQTAKLELKPKQPSVANLFKQVTVWIDPSRSLSLKQIFYEPSGDNRTATYTNLKYNAKIPSDIFKPKDKGFTVTHK